MLFFLAAYLSSSCEKEKISPINQEVAFVKYYGHVGAQTATDVIKTSDGGYILLGSTNSYSTRQEMDVLVVKTDSLGNELWSSAFGRAAEELEGKYLRFSEEGVRIIELPDQSAYVLAANRTYFSYTNASSPAGSGVKGQTKIVLYQLDYATGAPMTMKGVELQEATYKKFTEEVADMKLDTANGASNYILTGYTTNIQPNKPNDTDDGLLDKTDIFTALLNDQFVIQWQNSNLAYGFPRSDYGTSVQIIDDKYLICGISEEKMNNGSLALLPRITTIFMEKSGGTPINARYFTDEDHHFEGGYSVYDSDNGIITIAAHVLPKGKTGDKGQIALLQVNEGLVGVTPGGAPLTSCLYYDLGTRRNKTSGGQHKVASIALVPGNNGFIVSSTQSTTAFEFESDLCVTKFDKDLQKEEGWPYFFGYSDIDKLVLTKDEAGSIIPVTSGTGNQITVSGYVFTGKFGLGTNEMMGLVKLNLQGKLVP